MLHEIDACNKTKGKVIKNNIMLININRFLVFFEELDIDNGRLINK